MLGMRGWDDSVGRGTRSTDSHSKIGSAGFLQAFKRQLEVFDIFVYAQ
jgi:hypothetical protein